MESNICESGKQRFFAFLGEAPEPEMAPLDVVANFTSEADALRYSIDHIRKRRPGVTQMQIADELRWSRANMSKVLQEQAAIPKDSHVAITEHTCSLALAQYRNLSNGLVTKTIRQERKDRATLQALKDENAALKDELAALKSKYRRVVGE